MALSKAAGGAICGGSPSNKSGRSGQEGSYASERSKFSLWLAQPASLSFRNISFTVSLGRRFHFCGKSTGSKTIIKGITSSAHGGRMLAIVGGSGCGKTTLLNTLALSSTSGNEIVEGQVELNGETLTEGMFHRCGAYVAQDSMLWGSLTTKETLLYCAEFYGSASSRAEREALVDEVMSQTGLLSCAHTRVGNLFIKGLSGGQQKRLCVAEALVKRPSLVMLDEPTGGLDSSSAANVMEVLQSLTKNNILVLCTIHQPSQRVFSLFDDTLVLAQGQVAYSGPIKKATEYMTNLGMKPMERGVSLSEYLLDLTNPDFTNPEQVQHILDKWQAPPPPEPQADCARQTAGMLPLHKQVAILTRRLALMAGRDPTIYSARWVFAALSSVVFSLVYLAAATRSQDQVLPRIRLLSWLIGAPAFMTVIVIAVYNQDFHIYRKEVRNGMYTPLAYILSQTIVMVPGTALLSVFALIPAQIMVGFSWSALPMLWLSHAVVMLWADCVGQLLSVVLKHFLMAMVAFIMLMAVALVQSGVSISVDSLLWSIRWVAYVNPWMYSLRTMVWYDFTPAVFLNYESCQGLCFGEEGHQVLTTLNFLMSSISSEKTVYQDFIISIGITLAVKIAQYIAMRVMR